jgi:hypothetical protein
MGLKGYRLWVKLIQRAEPHHVAPHQQVSLRGVARRHHQAVLRQVAAAHKFTHLFFKQLFRNLDFHFDRFKGLNQALLLAVRVVQLVSRPGAIAPVCPSLFKTQAETRRFQACGSTEFNLTCRAPAEVMNQWNFSNHSCTRALEMPPGPLATFLSTDSLARFSAAAIARSL